MQRQGMWVSGLFVVIAAVAALWLYPQLPARVPVHWNAHGQINGLWTRPWAALFPAAMVALLAALTVLLPKISPRRFEIRPFGRVFVLIMLATQALVLVVGLATLISAAGHAVSVPRVAILAVGVLLMVLGNYMGKLRKNFFVGIRTPWTLASEATWERTHRAGGWVFMAAGLLVLVGTLMGLPLGVAIALIIAAALLPALYSFFVYWRLEGKAKR
ncbi:SdpI family protein [Oleiagrimonas sp. C23AA]|uniref:SdpI family protein n=1 Tax=Oleiagrimonas sp. C23AA TaxID=2719047 RepID=UPI001980A6A9|nr:SdpI family protein [Oleiagrimonas sp. C23AA]